MSVRVEGAAVKPEVWRTGRKIGRTIYRQVGAEPSDEDVPIGMMDTPGFAAAAVDGHNLGARWAEVAHDLAEALERFGAKTSPTVQLALAAYRALAGEEKP